MDQRVDAGPPEPEPPSSPETEQVAQDDLVCPFLGVAKDPGSRLAHPSPAHVCYAGKPASIDVVYQADYCLGGAFDYCARFRKATGRPIADAVRPASRSRLSLLTAALLTVALLTGAVALAIAAGLLELPGGGPFAGVGSATPSPTATEPDQPFPTRTDTEPTEAPPTITPSPSAEPTPEPDPTPGGVHVVQSGETLSLIAELYGVPWQLIAEANEIADPDQIFVGQQLTIPLPGQSGSDGGVHFVQAGETIFDIALLFDVSASDLADANELENWDLIYVGQRLIIPGREQESAPPDPEASP